ncbi:MAG: hypothetical protein HQ511_07205 [Rhodospirillales bacterium]|nr:hypothetical protein [Rhodospirillales bacterium]
MGQAFASGNIDFGGSSSEHINDDLNLLKFGIGAAARIGFPGDWPLWYPMFLDLSFTSYPGKQSDKKRGNQDSYIYLEENWRTAVMLGFTPWQFQAMKISLMTGIAIIDQHIRLDFGDVRREGRSRVQVVPSFGFEFATPLGALANIANIANIANTGRPIWFMGGTLDVLREVRVNGNGAQATAAGNLQYQLLMGIRFPL